MQFFSKPLFDTRGFSLLQLGATLVVLMVVGASGGLMLRGLRGGNERPQAAQAAPTAGNTIKQELTAQPSDFTPSAVVPGGYTVYQDALFGFSFAYPLAWGNLNLDGAQGSGVLATADVNKLASDTHGALRVQVFGNDEMYRPVPYKSGPTLRPQPTGGEIKWQVVEVSKAYSGYGVTAEFPAKTARVVPVSGGGHETVAVYEFTTTQDTVTSTVWIFKTNKGFVQITMPELSDAYDYDNHPIPADKEGYTALKKQIIQSIQISSLIQ